MPEIGDMKKYVTIIGILAVVVLTSIAVIAGFSKQVRIDTTVGVNGITLAANNSETALGSSYPFVQDVSSCLNDSVTVGVTLSTDYYSVAEGNENGGSLTLNNNGADWSGATVNCSVNYLADSSAQATGDSFVTGMTIFATFVGVLILAIIGVMIVKIYKKD